MTYKQEIPSICIVGIGNILRSDDGVGAYVCARLDEMSLHNVSTLVVHQLDPGILDDLMYYEHIVLVDASVNGKEIEFSALAPTEEQAQSSSHHVNATMLGALSRRIYKKELSLYLCAIRGEDFSIGNNLSGRATARAEEVISLISEWIRSLS